MLQSVPAHSLRCKFKMTKAVLVNNEYQEFSLERSNDRPVKFIGKILGGFSKQVYLDPSPVGITTLYKTKANQLVLHTIDISDQSYYDARRDEIVMLGDEYHHSIRVFQTIEQLINHIGLDTAAIKFYESCNLDICKIIN